jgi:peroxiredoxin
LTTRTLETVEGKEQLFKEKRQIWDGSRYLLRSKLPSMDHHNAYVSRDGSPVAAMTLGDRQEAFLDGFIVGFEGNHYAGALLTSAEMTLGEEMEEIDGHPCYVVEASRHKDDKCVFWIDPAAGYSLRKVVILGTDPAGSSNFVKFRVYDVQLEQVDGAWFPIAGAAEWRMASSDGRLSTIKYDVRRPNVIRNPDLAALGAFQMDLPDGTKVDMDGSHQRYVWLDGDIQAVRKLHEGLKSQPAPPMVIEQWYNANFWRLDFADKVIVLDFFGVWCRPCMAQVPHLKDLWKQYAPQGLVLIGVHTPQAKEGIPEFIAQQEIGYPIAVDHEGETAKKYDVYYYPTLVIIDRTGRIRSVNPEKDELNSLLKSLLD